MRMALFIAKRAPPARSSAGRSSSPPAGTSSDSSALLGIVVAPYPFKDWRVKPNAAGERRR